jgi:hypothetical protein
MTEKWEELSPTERYEDMFQQWDAAEGVEFVNAAAQERYHQALANFKDTLQLRVPDRVPFMPVYEMFPIYYQGLTVEDAMYDFDKTYAAWKQTILDTDPDLQLGPVICYPGRAFEALGLQYLKWPGNGVGPNQIYQFVEDEYMRADEYDEQLLSARL